MICRACRERRHDQCPGGSWCDCQHQVRDDDRAGGRDGAGRAGGPARPDPDPTTAGG